MSLLSRQTGNQDAERGEGWRGVVGWLGLDAVSELPFGCIALLGWWAVIPVLLAVAFIGVLGYKAEKVLAERGIHGGRQESERKRAK